MDIMCTTTHRGGCTCKADGQVRHHLNVIRRDLPNHFAAGDPRAGCGSVSVTISLGNSSLGHLFQAPLPPRWSAGAGKICWLKMKTACQIHNPGGAGRGEVSECSPRHTGEPGLAAGGKFP